MIELYQKHLGIVRKKNLARSYVWWPKIYSEIEMTVKSCKSCQINQTLPATTTIHPWKKTTTRRMRIHFDFSGPYMGKIFLIIYDTYLKWIDATPMTNITSSAAINRLRCTFSIHGIPNFIICDNRPSLASQEFNTFCKSNGMKHLTIAPYHPSSNSAAECLVKHLKLHWRK